MAAHDLSMPFEGSAKTGVTDTKPRNTIEIGWCLSRNIGLRNMFYEGVGCADLKASMLTPCFSYLACGLLQACNYSIAADTSAYLFLRTTVRNKHYLPKSPASTGFATSDAPC